VPRTTFDIDVLRSFALGVELGSFAQAADRLNRSTSAVSAQLKKLEEQAGAPLLRKAGRGLALTETGETMLGYARRREDLNDEAAAAVRGVRLEGRVRLGLQEDFGEHLLPAVLGRFARAHPKLRVEARIARNAELMEGIARGSLDLALAWEAGADVAHAERIARLPMRWIGAAHLPVAERKGSEPLPLVLLDPPCLVRSAATAALDRAGISWRIAFSSASSLISVASTCAAAHTASQRAVPSQRSAGAWKTEYRTAYGSHRPPSIHIALDTSTRTGLLDSSRMFVERCRRNSASKSGDM